MNRSRHLEPDPPPPRRRCAVYTRKSTEEGLEQAFNTLDAQRDACEAYVASQRADGWTLAPDRYDDGGFIGANLDRPALRRLLGDIEAGLVDVSVVYKIDRLSRALTDFARLIAAGADVSNIAQNSSYGGGGGGSFVVGPGDTPHVIAGAGGGGGAFFLASYQPGNRRQPCIREATGSPDQTAALLSPLATLILQVRTVWEAQTAATAKAVRNTAAETSRPTRVDAASTHST